MVAQVVLQDLSFGEFIRAVEAAGRRIGRKVEVARQGGKVYAIGGYSACQ